MNQKNNDEVLFKNAVALLNKYDQISAYLFQRRLGIGFVKACYILDQLEEAGYVTPQGGNKPDNPRKVLKIEPNLNGDIIKQMTSFQKLIGISALIISLTLAYYFLVYIPKRDSQKQELLQQEKDQDLTKLTNCVNSIEQRSAALWAAQCPSNNPNCSLNLEVANQINKQKENDRETCYKLFNSN